MARSIRDIPKAIASFGETQFSESGAASVEVLRVKAATIRKYFKQIRGIAFLVAVISLDRIRVYFFNAAGIMLIAENIEHGQYDPIRKKSKLVIKYEKPKPPTELELRMEATEELRSSLSKAIRRISRALGEKEPVFPDLYVTKEKFESSGQGFGVRIEEDGTLLFEEAATTSKWNEGIVLRTAFLLLMESEKSRLAISSCVGNAIAAMTLKDDAREKWNKHWIDRTSDEMLSIVNHFQNHLECYKETGFTRLLNLLRHAPNVENIDQWTNALNIIHESHEVSLGTGITHIVKGFCGTLSKPRKLIEKRHVHEPIHLAPRILCNTIPLGIQLSPTILKSSELLGEWMNMQIRDNSTSAFFSLIESEDEPLESIHYFLNIEDILPKSGGVLSHGRSIVSWALSAFRIEVPASNTFTTQIQFSEASLSEPELAVLERLSLGDLSIIANTIVGSPQRIVSLIKKGIVTLLPNFNHIGVKPNFLVSGKTELIQDALQRISLEYTLLTTKNQAFAVVSAPSIWGHNLLKASTENGFNITPIVNILPINRMLRTENPFSDDPDEFVWK